LGKQVLMGKLAKMQDIIGKISLKIL
jgi:hypothetical protein